MEREKTRILIVDDEPQNTAIIQEILYFHDDYIFEAVDNGYKALEIIDDFRPEIILLDVMMPGIDGYEVCRRIRNEESHRFIKIIMISGMSMIEERLKGYEAGADDYITKPFIEDELLAKIAVFSKLARIEEVDILKSTALYLMTHETRTPLNGILLGCEFLKEIEGLPRDAHSYIDIIHTSGRRMHELVTKINLLCQLKGGVELAISEKEANCEFQSIVSSIADKYGDQSFKYDSSGSYLLRADWELLTVSIEFVLDNAFKFGKGTGDVEITLGEAGEELFLEIIDSGPGLNRETMNRIFEGLFAEDILHHNQGSGLSLSICKLVMTHHQGQLTCANKDGAGALFRFIFPAKSFRKMLPV